MIQASKRTPSSKSEDSLRQDMINSVLWMICVERCSGQELEVEHIADAPSSYPSARASAQELVKGADICGGRVFALRCESVSRLGPRRARFDTLNVKL